MSFAELESKYQELYALREAGRLDQQHFDELVGTLRMQDLSQRWWQIDPASGQWLCWDGSQWQRAEPPRESVTESPPLTAPTPPLRRPEAPGTQKQHDWEALSGDAATRAQAVARTVWQRFMDRIISPGEFLRQSRLPLAQRSQGWWDMLPLAGGALSGYVWFVYASIRGMPHLKLIGMSGARDVWYDFIPSLFLVILPFLLFFYRKRILVRLDPIWNRVRSDPLYGLKLGGGLLGTLIALKYFGPDLFGWALDFREGLDFLTPLMMFGFPLGLVLFRAEIDHMLLPLQPLRQMIPKFPRIGLALAFPFALSFLLYRQGLTQYELLHWNVALGVLIPYILLREPQQDVPSSGGRGGAGTMVIVWLLSGLALLSGTMIPDVFADDCARDMFNLRDCLRTDMYAQMLSGMAATIVSLLVNGAEIIRSFVLTEPEQFPPQEPSQQPPGDIEWTAPDGRNNVLEWHPEKGGYINILTGGFVEQEGVGKWKENIIQTLRQTADWREHNERLTAAGLDAQSQALAAIKAKAVAAEVSRLQQASLAAARVRMNELLKAQQAADRDYWKDVKEGFWGGVVSDVDAIPGQLKDAAKASLKTIGETVGAVGREITDPKNWKALGRSVIQTGIDIIGSPIQSATKVGGFYVEVGTKATKIVTHIATHPVETIKAIAGVDNWSKAMDPNVPVTERIGRVLVGIADSALNLAGAGVIGSGARMTKAAVDAAKVVDKVSDAVRGADKVFDTTKAADKASDVAKGVAIEGKADAAAARTTAAEATGAKKRSDAYFKGSPDAAATRQKAWNEAQSAGQGKVTEFDKARLEVREAAKSGDAATKAAAEERLRKATLEVQGDKQALWDINKRSDAVKKDFNREMGGIYKTTDRMVVDDLCQKNGINPRDLRETMPGSGIYHNVNTGLPEVVVVKPTNVSGKIKVGADRDVTIRLRQYGDKLVADPENPGKFIKAGEKGVLTDVSSKELTPVYNKAFHHASGADKHFPSTSPKDFADKMDQVVTDRLHAEAYGRGQKDLQVAISKPGDVFSDAEQVSKAAQYKSEHLYKQSRDLAAQGKFSEAETAMGEGMRQSTKQFDNQVLKRAEALQAQGVDVTIPQRLKDDMVIMKKAQTEGWSPARITEELKVRHTTVEDVTQRSASMLESLQKLRPR